MEVSVNGDTPSSRPNFILGFSIINQPLGGSSIYGTPHVYITSIILYDDLYHIHYISYYILSISVIYHHKCGIISSIYIYIYLYIIPIIYYIYINFIYYNKLSMTLYHHELYIYTIRSFISVRWPCYREVAVGARPCVRLQRSAGGRCIPGYDGYTMVFNGETIGKWWFNGI